MRYYVCGFDRLWVSNEEPSYQAFVTNMLIVASAAPTQYAQLMNQSGTLLRHQKKSHVQLKFDCLPTATVCFALIHY